jgi:hypothetical protein
MKQKITVEQLQELTEEQKKRLREWWKLQPGDIMFDIKMGCLETLVGGSNGKAIIEHIEGESKARFLPLLSIGQMIELLQNSYKKVRWPDTKDKNLCNSLWSAVKEVL